jgi:hypothetical protein
MRTHPELRLPVTCAVATESGQGQPIQIEPSVCGPSGMAWRWLTYTAGQRNMARSVVGSWAMAQAVVAEVEVAAVGSGPAGEIDDCGADDHGCADDRRPPDRMIPEFGEPALMACADGEELAELADSAVAQAVPLGDCSAAESGLAQDDAGRDKAAAENAACRSGPLLRDGYFVLRGQSG